MPSKETPSAISDESIDHLDSVCKGKPRRFVMLSKGPSIVSLVVYKKGSLDKFIKEAKEAGTGTVSYGTVAGKGQNITFQLAIADGFKEEPTTATKLKSFLKDSAELTIGNPEFKIVDVRGPLLDPDDPLVARFLKVQDAALAAAVTYPERAAELKGLCAEIGKILDVDPSSDDAHSRIGKLEAILSGLALAAESAPAAPGAPATAAPTAPPVLNPEALRFAQRLKLLKPNLDKILAADIPVRPAAQKLFTEASLAFKQQDFAAAHRLLGELEPLVKQGLDELNSKALEAGDPAAKFNERLKALLPAIKAAAGTPAGNTAKLKASEAGVFANKKDFVQANALLDQLEQALQATASSEPAPTPPKSDSQQASADVAETGGAQSGRAIFQERMDLIEAMLLEAQKIVPSERNSLGNLWNFAVELVDQMDEADAAQRAALETKARDAFDRLEKAIDTAIANAPTTDTERFGIREGIVAERRAELEAYFAARLAAAEAATAAQVESVQKAVEENAPDEDPELFASAIQNALDEKYAAVASDLQNLVESQDATPDEILSTVEAKRGELAADPLLNILKQSKARLGVAADVSADFDALLNDFVAKVKEVATA